MKQRLLFLNRRLLCTWSCVFLLLGFFSIVHAEAPMAGTQASGYYRMMLGQFEITALHDSNVFLDTKLLKNAPETEIQRLLARMYITGPKMDTSTNAYVINTGSELVLVDAGRAMAFGPTPGNVMKNLKASGYDPSQVDVVLITHLHGDHIGGLLDETGKPAFTNATIYVSKAECDFFLSSAVAEKAPAAMQRYFKMARDIAAPYIALGKWKTFEEGKLPVPGIKAIAMPGHTPGHTAFEVLSGSQTLLIWGDLVHNMAVQFPNPDVSIEFDTDQKQAIATRKALFKNVVGRNLVAGMHLPFPGIGKVQTDGDNRYIWVPVEFFQVR